MRTFGTLLIIVGLLLGVTVIGLGPGALLVIIGLLFMIAGGQRVGPRRYWRGLEEVMFGPPRTRDPR